MSRLHTTENVPGAAITGVGAFRPVVRLSNDDLGVDDVWVRERTGIVSRCAAGETESVVDMAVAAGGKALAMAGADPHDIDLVLLATCSLPSPMPNGAASVAARLGTRASGAVDLNAACSGFCYGLGLADGAIRSGMARSVLVIGSERMRDWVDRADRTTSMIFADGAGAVLVAASDRPGVGPVVWGSQGEHADLITIPAWRRTITMRGPAVFRWTITALLPVALKACRLAGVRPGELAAFVPHQANLRIVETLARQLGADRAAIATDVTDTGNTSAASIPLALARLREEGRVRPGRPVLLLGFGAGLTYAAQVVHCP